MVHSCACRKLKNRDGCLKNRVLLTSGSDLAVFLQDRRRRSDRWVTSGVSRDLVISDWSQTTSAEPDRCFQGLGRLSAPRKLLTKTATVNQKSIICISKIKQDDSIFICKKHTVGETITALFKTWESTSSLALIRPGGVKGSPLICADSSSSSSSTPRHTESERFAAC